MADGGEGTLDAVLRAAGAAATRGAIDVEGAGGATIRAGYGIVDHAGVPTAVLEAAQVVAITDAAGMSVPVGARSTSDTFTTITAWCAVSARPASVIIIGGGSLCSAQASASGCTSV